MTETGTTALPASQMRWSWFQFVVPALLLWILTGRHGPGLYLLSGLFLLAAVISFFGLLIQAMTGRLCLQRSLGRGLNIGLTLLAFGLIHLSLESTRRFVDETAERISAECTAKGRCPQTISAWEPRSDRFSAQHMHDAWLRWPVLYRVEPDGSSFQLWLYVALDVGESRKGGVVRARTD